MECPYCHNHNHVTATIGKIKTVSCLSCKYGYKTGINGTPRNRLTLDFWGLQESITIIVDGRTVVLPAFTPEQRKECHELIG